MKTIYDKLRPKRHYKRKPLCPNKMGLCEYDTCRCDMTIKVKRPQRLVRALIEGAQCRECKYSDYAHAKTCSINNPIVMSIEGEYSKNKKRIIKRILSLVSIHI